MVTTHPGTVAENKGVFVYITGCDGTGKSTQARLMLEHYRAQGIEPDHLWLRFPFFLTLPLLVYARLRGLSWYEERNGVKQGYWDFRRSWLLRTLLPWVLLIDATGAAMFKVFRPLRRGKTIVCERFVFDMIVDLSLALGDPDFHRKLPGRLFLRLLPKGAHCTILTLDVDTLRQRRSDLEVDRLLSKRLDGFQRLAEDLNLPVLSSRESVEEVNRRVVERIMSKE